LRDALVGVQRLQVAGVENAFTTGRPPRWQVASAQLLTSIWAAAAEVSVPRTTTVDFIPRIFLFRGWRILRAK
jgi:hypothetical protein